MFRNKSWAGIHLAMHRGGGMAVGKGRQPCFFRVKPLPDNYCMFESVEFPTFHMNFMANGAGGIPRTKNAMDSSAQFFIRMVVSGRL